MRNCFRILGLSDRATKAQVQAAYERWVAHYKGTNYWEEPEYAQRKLKVLKSAYEEAFRLAGNDSVDGARAVVLRAENAESPTKRSSSSTRLRDAERKEAEHGLGEKFHQWMESRDESKARKENRKSTGRKKKTTDKRKFSDKFPELKKLNKENLKSAWDEFKSDAAGLAGADFNEEFCDNEREPVTESGTVTAPKEEKSGGMELLSVIATILIAGMTLFGSCGDDDISLDYDYDYVDEYGVEYEYDYIDNYSGLTDLDLNVKEIAEATREDLYAQDEHVGAHWTIDTDEELRPVADEFAKTYWKMDCLEEVTEHMQGEFIDYPGNTSMTLDQQLNYIFPFYGFLPVDEAQWYENPYTGERIRCFTDYLNYLMQSYDEYGQDEIQYISLADLDQPAASDLKIGEMATESADLLYEQEEESFSYTMISMEDESALATQAPIFSKSYWGKDSIEEVTLYLNETYESYPVDAEASLENQLDAIFAFYGFAPSEDAVWYTNPYTQGRIKSMTYT